MRRQTKLIFGFAVGLIAGAYVAKNVRDSYVEFLDAKELAVDYQARNAEALGRRFPARIVNNRSRRAAETGLRKPLYLC